MFVLREIITGIRVTLVFWVLTALIYPLAMLLVGQVLFNYQANGSLIKNSDGTVVGSALIGQPFSSNKYFWSRPSTINYSTVEPSEDKNSVLQTGVSGASNLAPSNPDLVERIRPEVERLRGANNIQPRTLMPADLVYTSGSGLDPHITIKGAEAQLRRVANARGLDVNEVELVIYNNTDRKFLGIFGEDGVNVLKVNMELDAKASPR